METPLYMATATGVVVFDYVSGAWRVPARGITAHRATAIAARAGTILAGTTDGIFRSEDLGRAWAGASSGLSVRRVRWLAYHPQVPGLAFAGTEPAAIFVTRDDGRSWRECPEVARLRDENRWYLPYSPRAGCVRGFAFNGPRGYAAVEQGGLLLSDDEGEHWRLAEGSTGDPRALLPKGHLHADVHSIAVHPSSADLVYAPTGGGFFRSKDGGRTWDLLYDCYCRAVWIDPDNPDRMVLGPADGVSRNGRIEQSTDGGKAWTPASGDRPVPWSDYMVERFVQAGDALLAVLSNGRLLVASLDALDWRGFLEQVTDAAAVALMQP